MNVHASRAGAVALVAALAAACSGQRPAAGPAAPGGLDRTVLPIHEPAAVIVLIDDIGFGASSAFGGPIRMPTLEKMAANGSTMFFIEPVKDMWAIYLSQWRMPTAAQTKRRGQRHNPPHE